MSEAARRFIERLGLLAEEEGFARIAGRMFGLLLLEEGPFGLDELADRLQVSKASVSTNARALERLGLVERVSVPGDRRDFYRISDSPWEQMFAVVRRRMQRTHDLLAEGCAALPDEMEVGRRRLSDWHRFYAFLLEDFEVKVERWRARRRNGSDGGSEGPPVSGGSGGRSGSIEENP